MCGASDPWPTLDSNLDTRTNSRRLFHSWWKGPLIEKSMTKDQAVRKVDFENLDGRSAYGASSNEDCAVPPKMGGPFVSSRMKKADDCASLWIDS